MIKDYIIANDCVILFIPYKKEIKIAYIDLEDLEKILSFPYAWFTTYDTHSKSHYVVSSIYRGKRNNGTLWYHPMRMHKYVLDYFGEYKVDHINHDTLDNRKSNLRISENIENTKHRKGKNSNNTSGYRNVSWINSYKKWCVQLQINGKNTLLGKFDDVHEAGKFAEEMRKKYYKEYKGAS